MYSSVITNSPTGDNSELGLTLEQAAASGKQVLDEDAALADLIASAENGDAQAQGTLGMRYHKQGEHTDDLVAKTENFKQARKWFKKSAQQGNPVGQYGMGMVCDDGVDEPADIEQAVQWYRAAANQDYAPAQYVMGLCHKHGTCMPKDFAQAHTWLQKAAHAGNSEAQLSLGEFYLSEEYGFHDLKLAIEWIEKSAAQGNYHAIAQIGSSYETGNGKPKDLAKAKQWYLLAAQKGHAQAQTNLASILSRENTPENQQEAFKWYLKAAQQGHAPAQFAVGTAYVFGSNNMQQDIGQATKWYRQAAAQKYAPALNTLASHYTLCLGVPLNPVASYALLRLANVDDTAKRFEVKAAIATTAKMLTRKHIRVGDKLFEELSKSTDFLKTLDDFVNNFTGKSSLATNVDYIEMVSNMLRTKTLPLSPVELPKNDWPVKLTRNQRKAKSKKR
jgi:TPR repeat protein